MKKLLFLMKLQPGETPRQFARRVWQSLRSRNLIDEQGKLKLPQEEWEVQMRLPQDTDESTDQSTVPNGLYKCEKCGEYKGSVKHKDLNWDGSVFDTAEVEESQKILTVSCLCDGILCPKCQKNKIHRPVSNSYDLETNTIEHWPWFTGMAGCEECRKK